MAPDDTHNEAVADSRPAPLAVRGLGGLLAVFALVGIVAIAMAGWWGGGGWALSACLSAVACLAGAILGHIFSVYPRGDAYLVSRLYLSMMMRAGIPLALLFVCRTRFESLFDQGMVYFVILFYLVGLLTELKVRMQMLGNDAGTKKSPAIGPATELDG